MTMKTHSSMDANESAWVVREAIENLLEYVAAAVSPEDLQGMRDEAKKLVIELCSTVILADGRCDSGEREFLHLLVKLDEQRENRFLLEQTALWDGSSKTVPRFFEVAVARDPDLARSMLREIQFIGNNVAIGDGDFQAVERKTVRNYVAFLEKFMESSAPR
jgi:tellurite resistance protein